MIRMTLAALAALTPLAALAQDGLTIRDAYVRSTNPQVAAAFMVIENPGTADCRLTGAASTAAQRVGLHTNSEQDGVMRMQPVESITVPAGGAHALERGGDHVMMMGLTQPLVQGDAVILDLDFGDCGSRRVEARVDNDNDRAPAGGSAPHRP